MQALEIALVENGHAALSQASLDLEDVKQHAFMAACEALSLCNAPLAGLAAPEAALIKHVAVPVDEEVAEALGRYLERLMDAKAASSDSLEAAKSAAAHTGALGCHLIASVLEYSGCCWLRVCACPSSWWRSLKLPGHQGLRH